MAIFLMIHGAWHGGWCFEPLRPSLEHRGHTLLAPTLPGMGGHDVPAQDVTLSLWTRYVCDIVEAQPEPVILCGHSRGGIVISSVAEARPDAVRCLVYIAAFLLPDGQSLRAFQTRAPNPEFAAAISPVLGGHAVAFDAQAASRLFYNRTDESRRSLAVKKLTAEPTAPLATPLCLSAERFGRVPRHYIECIDDRAIFLARQREMQAALPCETVSALDADHSPFFSCPSSLADCLTNLS
jgi:pimeloyl-ACP methyl ester carboxylesterase